MSQVMGNCRTTSKSIVMPTVPLELSSRTFFTLVLIDTVLYY